MYASALSSDYFIRLEPLVEYSFQLLIIDYSANWSRADGVAVVAVVGGAFSRTIFHF